MPILSDQVRVPSSIQGLLGSMLSPFMLVLTTVVGMHIHGIHKLLSDMFT